MKQKLAARIARIEQRARGAASGPLFILIKGVVPQHGLRPGPEETSEDAVPGYERQDGEIIRRRPGESAAARRERIASGLVRPELFFEIGAPPHRS